MKPARIALAYVAFSALALALFALPLLQGWRDSVGTLRVFVPHEMHALTELFHREGPAAVADAVRGRPNPTGHEVLVFSGPDKEVLAGTLRRWPSEIPEAPGTYGHVIGRDDGSRMRIVVSRVNLPGGYQLLMGRESVGLMSMQGRFWYGMAGAAAVVLGLGGALAWLLARRAREARLSEARYARALQATNDGIWEWRPDTDEIFLSQQARRLWAVPQGVECRTRAVLMSLGGFHREDLPHIEREIARCGESSAHRFDIECRVVDPDSSVRWVRWQGRAFAGAEGSADVVTGSVTDITERKHAVDALRESDDRYALAVAGSDVGVFDADFVRGRVFFSARARELTGLPPSEEAMTVEQYLQELPLHPEDLPRRTAALQAHLAGDAPAYEGEFRVRQLDGEYRWRRIHGLCLRDVHGKPQRMAGSISDVDVRRRAEDARRLSEERYALAMLVAEEGHCEWNMRTREIFASAQAKRVMNLPLDLALRTDADVLSRVPFHPDDAASVTGAWEAFLAARDDEHELVFRILRGEESRWVRAKWRIFRDVDDGGARVIGVVSDITGKKLAEEELRKMEGQLRSAQRLEAIGTLAGGIAHDFNNILGAILGYCEMAMRAARGRSRLRRDLESILAAGERGRSLVDRILAFSPSGVGEHVPVHVEAVVREALDQIAVSLPPSITMASGLRAGRAAMLGDSTQVHQVVMNLASNAVQAMSERGILTVQLDTTFIEAARPGTVGSLFRGNYIVLKVADTGNGISSEVFERMFDPFFTTKEVGVGSGLGLSLVHGIVTNVDGAIDVETAPGKGTTFAVYFRRSGDALDEPACVSQVLPRGEGQRVLVVDDEEALVRIATASLAHLGYAPIGFTSSAEALAAFRADPTRFDIVLTDERMPGLCGSMLIREVRSIRGTIPMVLMSGYVGTEPVDADVVVRKPLSERDLAISLNKALHH